MNNEVKSRSMWRTAAQRILIAVTLLAPGLYAGRVLSERLHPDIFAAAVLTLALAAGGAAILPRLLPRRPLWPALVLYLYVLYPALDPGLAFGAGALALLSLLITQTARLPGKRQTPTTRLLAALIVLAGFLLYWRTLSPGLLSADNGELQVVATRLGVAHPPGFALYTLLAHIATRLPLGPTPAYRANLFSAILAAATLGVVFLSGARLTGSRLAGLVSAMALATATTFWAQATTANVRMLTGLFAALVIYLLLLYRSACRPMGAPPASQQSNGDAGATRSPPDRDANRLLFLFALALSLGVTHHASLIFMSLVFVLSLLRLERRLWRQLRRWRWPIAGFVLGVLPLLYFPIRALTARQPVRGVTPALATLSGFVEHVLALGFRGDLFAYSSPQEIWTRLQVMGNVLTFQFHWLLLAGMVLGFIRLLRRQQLLALALGGAFLVHTLVTTAYRAPQTVEYMLPAYVPAVLLLAAAVSPGVPQSSRHERRRTVTPATSLLTAALLIVAIAQGIQRYPSFAQLARDHTARKYGAAIMARAPGDSAVLADWHWATPLWYLQEVEGARPDLQIQYVFPTAEAYGETWARRIAANLEEGRPVVATHFDAATYGSFPPAEPLADAFLFRQEPRATLSPEFITDPQTFGDLVELIGYRVQGESLAPLREGLLTLAWRPVEGAELPDLTLFVHLANAEDGVIVAQQDVPARPMPAGITLTQLRLTPRLATRPGAYTLYVGVYESATGRPLPASDGAERTLLHTVLVAPMPSPPYTEHRVYGVQPPSEPRLVGYDWDNTLAPQTRLYLHWRTDDGYVTEAVDNPGSGFELPSIYGPWGIAQPMTTSSERAAQHYVPLGAGVVWTGKQSLNDQTASAGERLTLAQYFAAGRPLQEDFVVSVRLIGYEADGIFWNWWDLDDGVPALGAIPTLKWIAGSQVRDLHFVTVSPNAREGQTLGGLVTLYDAFTQRQLPVLDERITEQHLGIPLGSGAVQDQN